MSIFVTVYESFLFYFGAISNLKLRFIQQEKSLKILFNRVNPLRAGLVERPEQFRWNSLGYHVQTNNRNNFFSSDFG